MNPKTTHPLVADILTCGAIGIAIGTSIELALAAAGGLPYTSGSPSFIAAFDNELTAILVERLVYAGVGVATGFGARIFQIERLSLLTATIAHLVLCMGAVLTAGVYLRWFALDASLIPFIGEILIIYWVIWLIAWMQARRTVNRVNASLPRR